MHAYTERKAQCPPASSRLLLVPPGPASSSRRSCRRCVRSSPHGRRRGQPRAVSELARVRPEPGHARLAAVRLHRRRDRSSHLVLLVVPRDHLRTAARPVGRRTTRIPWQGAGRRGVRVRQRRRTRGSRRGCGRAPRFGGSLRRPAAGCRRSASAGRPRCAGVLVVEWMSRSIPSSRVSIEASPRCLPHRAGPPC